jgi:hypothetical protein
MFTLHESSLISDLYKILLWYYNIHSTYVFQIYRVIQYYSRIVKYILLIIILFTHYLFSIHLLFTYAVQGMEHRGSHILGKSSITELYPKPVPFIHLFIIYLYF